MCKLLSTLELIPKAVGLYVEAIFHTGYAFKSHDVLVKSYKKTLKRQLHVNNNQTN